MVRQCRSRSWAPGCAQGPAARFRPDHQGIRSCLSSPPRDGPHPSFVRTKVAVGPRRARGGSLRSAHDPSPAPPAPDRSRRRQCTAVPPGVDPERGRAAAVVGGTSRLRAPVRRRRADRSGAAAAVARRGRRGRTGAGALPPAGRALHGPLRRSRARRRRRASLAEAEGGRPDGPRRRPGRCGRLVRRARCDRGGRDRVRDHRCARRGLRPARGPAPAGNPRPLDPSPRAAGAGGRARRRGPRARRRLRAGAHRPGRARRDGAIALDRPGPGERCRAARARRARPGAGVAAGDRGGGPHVAGRGAPRDRIARHRPRRDRSARPRLPPAARRPIPLRRARRGARRAGRSCRALAGSAARGVPDPAGGAHQCAPPQRRRPECGGAPRLGGVRAAARGRVARSPGSGVERVGPRGRRHAGAGRARRRLADRGGGRRRIPRHRVDPGARARGAA